MVQPQMFEVNKTYEIFKPVQKNCRFLVPNKKMRKMMRRTLAFAAKKGDVSVNDFSLLPHGASLMVTLHNENSSIPLFMESFCYRSWRYGNRILGRKGPIWAKYKGKPYYCEPLETPDKVLLTHAKFRLEARRLGYSKDNNIFGGMILRLKRLGSKRNIFYKRPVEAQQSSKLEEFAHLAHPISPLLKKLGRKRARNQVKQLIKRGRHLIDKQRKRRKKTKFEDEKVLEFRNRPTPRPTTEKQRNQKYEVCFSYQKLLSSEARTELSAKNEAHETKLCLFLKKYRIALNRWRAGHHDHPFPEGTYKMVRLHSAETTPIQLL